MELISQELSSLLVTQMGEEKTNAHIYLYIAGFLRSKGMEKLAEMFEKQYEEENEHFFNIYKFLTDLDIVPAIPSILGVEFPINTIEDVAEKFMSREILTTDNLFEIKQVSSDEQNSIVEEFMRKMIDNQRAEYAEATDFRDKSAVCGSSWMNVLLWNNSL